MYFISRLDTDMYYTIHSSDAEKFYEVVNSGVFKTENKFSLIKNKADIKTILETRYSSKNRTSEYTAGLPSATLISSALFPYDLDSRHKPNSIPLLKWANDISIEDLQAQRLKNKLSTDSGEFCHEILESALNDKKTRTYDKVKKIDKYIDIVCNNNKIKNIINNFDNRKEYFISMAKNTLSSFFENELKNIDPIFCELFLVNKGIQGAIDCLAYKNKRLYILDHKTSKKSCSYNEIPKKGYWRQLYIYSRMLLNLGVISKREYDNLGFQINFFNWNTGKSAIYEIPKEDIDKHSKAYCEFILQWYYDTKDMGINVKEVL